MTYAAPAHPPPPAAPPRSSGPKRWVWFVIGIGAGLILGLAGAGIVAIVRLVDEGSVGSIDDRPDIEALVGENYCYRIAEKLGMDYVGDDLAGDSFGLNYGGTCTLTQPNPPSEEFGHTSEASFEVALRNLHPLIDWVRDCHDGQRAGGLVRLPGEVDERTCVVTAAKSRIGWAGRMVSDSLSITVTPRSSEHPQLEVRLVEILDAAESELS
ncbi:hypothetical protein ACFVJS_23480 [Nocardioides sp. NPDC057772]|uniref:hypothetical protein n=1 Tax=Nocardioides sp. NPDC057772 TaxID=3346245 RepID=UPI00366F03AF